MSTYRSLFLTTAFVALIAPLSLVAHADPPFDRQVGDFFSGTGTILYIVAGVGAPLIEDGKVGKTHALRSLDALTSSVLLSEGMKSLVQEKRPDTNSHDSFPSEHASSVFAIATVESAFHPKQAIYWYAGASLISASRFTTHRHTVGDVLAGAALGYGVGRWELSTRRGLLLMPFIQPTSKGTAYGLFLSKTF
ncbi:MAG: Membrane-associated phospholipid phosphatase [Chthonomonadaceae bacterium]|nr:Membrane-associated phospholipid phosphatase [Chthonomonadaceae bacterium]